MSIVECGTLNDESIIKYVKDKKLIVGGFKKENVKQACYEMRASNVYFDLNEEGTKHELKDGEEIIFRPHQTIVVISEEKFNIPDDILARFITKGSLFSVGFVPINTYADPGFVGRMGIVMNNASNNYLRIPCGDAIAKIEFVKLQFPVNDIYHGQHGFETGIWPIRNDYIIPPKSIKNYFPKENAIDSVRASFGDSAANIMHRILISERRFLIATIIFIIVDLIGIAVLAGTEWLSPIKSVVLGIITNIVYAILAFVIDSHWHK